MSDNDTCNINSACAGKQVFETAATAARAKNKMEHRVNARRHRKMTVYRCAHCRSYHLGSALKHNIKQIRVDAKRTLKGYSSRA